MKRFLMFFILLVSLSMVIGFAANNNTTDSPDKLLMIRQVPMERSPGTFDRDAYARQQLALYDWLMSESVPLTEKAVISIQVTSDDLTQMESVACESCGNGKSSIRFKERVGLTKPVSINVALNQIKPNDLSGVSYQSNGMVRPTSDGGFVWGAAAESYGAAGVRVHFVDFNLPENAALYVYNNDGEAFGPYTGKGPNGDSDFWSNTISGSLANIQLRVNGELASNSGGFRVSDIAHLTQKFLIPFLKDNNGTPEGLSATNEFCSFNEPCVEDASCYNVSAVNDARDAVAHMQFVSGGWIYICTGGLIADSDPGTQIPYFLTANHCLSRDKIAGSLECFWQFETSNCGGACYDPVGVVPRTLGASIVATNKTGDYTLMELAETPPSGSAFLGWSTQDVAFVNNTDLYRISHPMGAPQAYSQHRVDTSAGTCSSWPRGSWIYSKDVVGATEGGSSGSPVVNGNGQVVGQLSGACGTNVNDVCDTVNNATVDGAFASYFTEVEPYLGTGGSSGSEMHVDSIVLSIKAKGPKTDVIAKVVIVDENGNPVADATVSGTFSGEASGSTSAVTDASGEATLKLTIQASVSSFTFCVDNVTHSSYTYNSTANIETCDTY